MVRGAADLQGVEHRHVALGPHLVGEEYPAEHQAERVSEGRLAPHQPACEYYFSSAW
jgi:hypothetical protein